MDLHISLTEMALLWTPTRTPPFAKGVPARLVQLTARRFDVLANAHARSATITEGHLRMALMYVADGEVGLHDMGTAASLWSHGQ